MLFMYGADARRLQPDSLSCIASRHMASATAPTSFPPDSLLIAYEECERFVQAYLQSFSYGELKPWAADRKPAMNYRTLSSLRNGKMRKPVPLIVNRILEERGFVTKRISAQVSTDERATYFQFPDKEKLADFKKEFRALTKIR